MNKIDWYGIFIMILIPTIVSGIIFSAFIKSAIALASWNLLAVITAMYWIEHKQGGVIINMKEIRPTSGAIAIFLAGFIGGAVFLFVLLSTVAPVIIAALG